jgi:hypothetical protein
MVIEADPVPNNTAGVYRVSNRWRCMFGMALQLNLIDLYRFTLTVALVLPLVVTPDRGTNLINLIICKLNHAGQP